MNKLCPCDIIVDDDSYWVVLKVESYDQITTLFHNTEYPFKLIIACWDDYDERAVFKSSSYSVYRKGEKIS